MATTDFVITITFSGATQTQSDNRRDNGVLDYARARGLAIFEADGITLKPNAAIAALVRAEVKQILKNEVVRYRELVAAGSAVAPVKAAVDLEIP